jgi:hypothetical protein
LAFLQSSAHEPGRKGKENVGGLERAETLVSMAGEEKRWKKSLPENPREIMMSPAVR